MQEIWQQYYDKLVRLARRKLGPMGRRSADEEDVALSAFHSFYRGASQGRFPKLNDRHDLWKLLVTITCRKAIDLFRRHFAATRPDARAKDEAALAGGNTDRALEQLLGQEPTPGLSA